MKYKAAYNKGDALALAGLYTDDAVLMPPDGTTRIGPVGIVSYYQPRFDQFDTDLTVTLEETGMLGEWGFGRGEFAATMKPKEGGDPLQVHGKWMEICAVQPDGSWKIARHIWNSPKPLFLLVK